MSQIRGQLKKRLIVCCDGTWNDSTADSARPPSNLTRFGRALSQTAIVEQNGQKKEIPQILYYQKGVGTSLGDKYWGGVAGLGVSANVRAAYGFLANNYSEGDEIFFFGFSRGAYTARAVAGLVCQWGLLTPRGMDNFTNIYHSFYEEKLKHLSDEKREQLGFRESLPPFTVKIIGVWDTVGFQKAWLGRNSGEKLELRNTILSPNVKYAFHALALDEERTADQPIMWHIPEQVEGQELLQVWFSGVHTDIGGGDDDPHLSNITLAWMIAQCMKHGQLSFDIDEYLFDKPPADQEESASLPWATNVRTANNVGIARTLQGILSGKSHRTPLAYSKASGESSHFTGEMIHSSINDRNLSGQGNAWPCPALKGRGDQDYWILADKNKIADALILEKEIYMKGRIRTVHVYDED